MTLEGSLEAFSLPDIFQLLAFTKKTGALRITSTGEGVVYFGAGSVTGASSDVTRQSLGRRLVGAGLVDDDKLDAAVAAVDADPATGFAKALASAGAVEDGVLHDLASEQATDAVFDLLRLTRGDFAFSADELNPDDLGVTLAVEEVIAEARRRLEVWETLTKVVPSPDAVVTKQLRPEGDATLSPEEWSLLALVDGRRRVAELVALLGRGEFAVVSTLSSLIERGLVGVRRPDEDGEDSVTVLLRRQSELARLEGFAVITPEPAADEAPEPVLREVPKARETPVPDVVPARPEPLQRRTPDFPEDSPVPASRRATSSASHGGAGTSRVVTRTAGSAAVAAETAPEPAVAGLIERDPSVNKSLLLRLIAGVRGL
jgi:hypothetical protein